MNQNPQLSDGIAPDAILRVSHVTKFYRGVPAVRDVSFTLRRGRSLAVIGESGSGKTTLTSIAMGLLRPDCGDVEYYGDARDSADTAHSRDTVHSGETADSAGMSIINNHAALLRLRRESGIVHQDPFASLDPRWSALRSIAEPLRARGVPRDEAERQAAQTLQSVGLDPRVYGVRLPVDLSGGQAQRVAIARALVVRPRLLLADEPMSAIDVTARLQILDVLGGLRGKVAMLVVLHDLGVAQRLADDVIVMHHGDVVERGTVDQVLTHPRDSYTRRLIAAATL
ncbi:ABC transporter ATP-binding protein [Pseudoscardovia suis]|uniref:ABC transporter ATP-binding protein n=1 Tax=Pseudoscardovia suis TaxID=987063 RepID=UPI001FD37BE1|nr:dipeptide/oligopeptide/nickel ABC transporter ATP-binding protein [Pseudoscardovia suis]